MITEKDFQASRRDSGRGGHPDLKVRSANKVTSTIPHDLGGQ